MVVACADARHVGCARACIEGLGERKRRGGKEVFYVHVSFFSSCPRL